MARFRCRIVIAMAHYIISVEPADSNGEWEELKGWHLEMTRCQCVGFEMGRTHWQANGTSTTRPPPLPAWRTNIRTYVPVHRHPWPPSAWLQSVFNTMEPGLSHDLYENNFASSGLDNWRRLLLIIDSRLYVSRFVYTNVLVLEITTDIYFCINRIYSLMTHCRGFR